MPKKSRTQEILEAQVIHKGKGRIDLKRLWKEIEETELDPIKVKALQNET